jgi:hypothetical protein
VLIINDYAVISLKIDGEELQYGGLQRLLLTEGNGVFVPAIKLDIQDPTSLLSTSSALTEGNTIELVVSKNVADSKVKPRKYRMYGPTRQNNALNPIVSVVGILDAPKFFSASSRDGYNAASDSVLKQLAEKSGLTFSGPTGGKKLNDSQVWLNVCTNRAGFTQDVSQHGWMDQHSGMVASVTSFGELRYRNLIDEINTKADNIQFVFSHNTMPNAEDSNGKIVYIVREARDRSTAGTMATWMNYGSTRVKAPLSGKDETVEKLEVKTPGSFLSLNQEVADMVKRVRFDYGPIDCGNTHDKYEEALYQNIKIRALFSERMSILVNVPTDVQLYDPVIYRQADADLKEPVSVTDIYLVVGKTIEVRGGLHYAERIELARMSLTMKGTTELKQPATANGERTMLPDVGIDPSSKGVIASTSNAAIKGMNDSVNAVRDAMSPIRDIATNSLKDIKATSESVKAYAAARVADLGVVEALRNVIGAANGAQAQVSALKDYASNSVQSVNALVNAAKNYPQSLRGAVLGQANGAVAGIVAQMDAITSYSKITGALKAVGATLPAKYVHLPEFKTLDSISTSMTAGLTKTTEKTAQQWNKAVSGINNIDIPTIKPLNTIGQRFDKVMVTATTTQDQVDKFATREMTKNPKTGNWAGDNEFYSSPNSVPSIQDATGQLDAIAKWKETA